MFGGRASTPASSVYVTRQLSSQVRRASNYAQRVNDPWPTNDVIRTGTAELVQIVRRRLPDRYYGGETWWSLVRSAALVRMADIADAAMVLGAFAMELDGRTVVRSLYEQAVTFAWIAADPDHRLLRWRNDAIAAQLRLHNDAVQFGRSVLTDEEVVADKKTLDWRKRGRQAGRDPEHVLPSLATRAQQADQHWAERIEGLHSADHPLGFRGLYVSVLN